MANERSEVSKGLRTKWRVVLELAEVEVGPDGQSVNYAAVKRAVVFEVEARQVAEREFEHLLKEA